MKRVLPLILLLTVTCGPRYSFDVKAHEQEILKWREQRRARLTSPDSWLSLVGLDWLHEGSNEVKLPGGPAGTVTLVAGKTTLTPAKEGELTIGGKPVTGPVELKNDFDPAGPTVVQHGTTSFQVIKRNDRYALRIKDPESPARKNFLGLDYFPVAPQWRLEAKFVPYNPPKKIPITNVLGMTGDEVSPGALVFTVDGKEYRIDPILEQGETDLFIIFKDQTSKDTTYPAGRYVYAHPPGPDGKTVLDFNKAYNPPCTFTPFATCPLPPAQNRLPFRIEAGEKRYRGGHA